MVHLRHTFLLVLITLCGQLVAQTAPFTWWIAFTDKARTPYSLEQPAEFLSQRALERRAAQGIALDSLDLPVDPAYITGVLATGDVQLLLVSRWTNSITIRTTNADLPAAIAALPYVAEVEGTGGLRSSSRQSNKWQDLDRVAEMQGIGHRQLAMVNGHLLQELGGVKGEGMLIGLLDTGYEGVDHLPGFAALRARAGVRHVRDFYGPDADIYQQHPHGRMVLSIMAADLPGQLAGSAPHADYVLVRTEYVDSEYRVEEDAWISGAEYCDSLGCDLINTSLGYTTFDDPAQDHTHAGLDGRTYRMSRAATTAAHKGMLVVNSAGNQGEEDWYRIGVPADAEDILSVGAVTTTRAAAAFSSRGPSADGRVKPEVSAMGMGIIGLGWDPYTPGPINGTSFSAPLVSGLTACLWQLHPQRTAAEIRHAVIRSADHYHTPNIHVGYGIPDYWRAHLLLSGTDLTDPQEARVLVLWPNPFADHFDIDMISADDNQLSYLIHDMQGRVVASGIRAVEPGTFNRVRFAARELATLSSGMYTLALTQNGLRSTHRVLRAAP